MFAATGLLIRPNENAEELLVRAHHYDARAIALVFAGYAQGINGFPKDRNLAAIWGRQLAYLGAIESMDISALQLWPKEQFPDESLGVRLANCDSARKSSLAPLFKKVGILDVDQICAELEKKKTTVSGWEKSYRQALLDAQTIKQQIRAAMATMRGLRQRPATPKEQKELNKIMEFVPVSVLLFYAATTHDPDKEAPDWQTDRLFAFLDAQRSVAGKAGTPRNKTEGATFAAIVPLTGEAILRRMSEDPAQASALIRAAHSVGPGSQEAAGVSAIRAMARHYRDGSYGFIQDKDLSRGWMRHAALENDYESMLLLAVDMFAQGKPAEAWAWASTVRETENAAVSGQVKTLATSLMAFIESREGKAIEKRGLTLALQHLDERKERLEWRIQLEEKKRPPSSNNQQ